MTAHAPARRLVGRAALVLVLAGLGGVSQIPAFAGAGAEPSSSLRMPEGPLTTNEVITFSGYSPGEGVRPVRLQVARGGPGTAPVWNRVTTVATDRDGGWSTLGPIPDRPGRYRWRAVVGSRGDVDVSPIRNRRVVAADPAD